MADGGSNIPDALSLLYAGLAAIVTALAAMVTGALRGKLFNARQESSMPRIPPEQYIYYDGPLAKAFNELNDVKNHQAQLVKQVEGLADEARKQTDLLAEIKILLENMPSRRR